MIQDDPLVDLWETKEKLSLQFASARKLVAEADRIAREEPLPPAGKSRKMIEGFPCGQSVADDDEVMMELHRVKEKLAAEYLGGKRSFAAPDAAGNPKKPSSTRRKKTAPFRSLKGKTKPLDK
jgi:hypothetical protein